MVTLSSPPGQGLSGRHRDSVCVRGRVAVHECILTCPCLSLACPLGAWDWGRFSIPPSATPFCPTMAVPPHCVGVSGADAAVGGGSQLQAGGQEEGAE